MVVNAKNVMQTSNAKLQASSKAVKRFSENGLVLSAHWETYSYINGKDIWDNEWNYFVRKWDHEKYVELAKSIDAPKFDANEWADLMLECGFKSLLITSKHHDGFCMYDTALTDFKVTNSKFGRDPMAELAKALQDRGIGLQFYYSLVDWTHPDFHNDWKAYVQYYQCQIKELCTNYGKLEGVLFDGWWQNRGPFKDKWQEERFTVPKSYDLGGTFDIIHKLQPDAMVVNNHHLLPMKGEDYQVWELDIPGENKTGFNCPETGTKPKACWWNINAGWSYQPWNHNVKTAEELYESYKRVKKLNGAFYINVGPRPFGDIHPEEQAVLRSFGKLAR